MSSINDEAETYLCGVGGEGTLTLKLCFSIAKSHQSLCSKPPDVVPLFIKISYTLKMDHGAPHDLVSMKLYIFILFHSLPSILDTLSSEVFRVSAPNDSIPYSLIFQSPVSFLHGKPRYVILYLCFLLFQTISN